MQRTTFGFFASLEKLWKSESRHSRSLSLGLNPNIS